jgi:anaerobic selenocysteine-containing dehydrogenase
MDVQHDPDRLRMPVKRVGDRWIDVPWEEAFDDVATRLAAIQDAQGPHAVAFYYGNPTGHSYAAMLFGLAFSKSLGTKNVFSANSVDALPRLVTSLFLYGNQAVLPIPDLDRTRFLLILGANPVVSNGSVMTAPGAAKRLAELKARGGTIVVVDPRRTETAELADAHLFIRPGTDALLLAAMLHTIFAEGLDKASRSPVPLNGLDDVRAMRTTSCRRRGGSSMRTIRCWRTRSPCGTPHTIHYLSCRRRKARSRSPRSCSSCWGGSARRRAASRRW